MVVERKGRLTLSTPGGICEAILTIRGALSARLPLDLNVGELENLIVVELRDGHGEVIPLVAPQLAAGVDEDVSDRVCAEDALFGVGDAPFTLRAAVLAPNFRGVEIGVHRTVAEAAVAVEDVPGRTTRAVGGIVDAGLALWGAGLADYPVEVVPFPALRTGRVRTPSAGDAVLVAGKT